MTHADLVFSGGPVFAATTQRTRAAAVAVRDGRIVAVGPDVGDLIGPRTEVVDLGGRMLVPGFQDAHVHPVWGGLYLLRCDLTGARGRDDYLSRIAAYVASHPDAEWILGAGWAMAEFPGGTPLAADLDRIVPDRPVFLVNRDGHGAWVNSRALELAGIDSSTPDPLDGRIERDADGRPSGTLHEGAMSLVSRLLPEDDLETMVEALRLGQRYLHSLGVTGWQDAAVGAYSAVGDPGPAYRAAAQSGELTARVVGALWFDRTRGLDQLPELLDRRERLTTGRFAATSVKIMQDGVPENFTAAMLEPYHHGHAGHGHGGHGHGSGISFIDPAELLEVVPRLDALGFQVHFHAIGDRAVRECLDAVAAAVARHGPSDNRHHIAHLQVVHPDDIPRFRQLGVAANIQSLWAALDAQMIELNIPFLGEERTRWQYPFGDLLRSGAVIAAGSDWSVTTPDPLAAIHVAVNRRAAPGQSDRDYDVFLPEQRIDLASSLVAYTAGSAWVNHLDDVTGTIEEGKLADLAVLDRDPFAGPPASIGETRVLQTFVEGERVFSAHDA